MYIPALQNGKPALISGSSQTERLDAQGRLEGRLSGHQHLPITSEISEICVAGAENAVLQSPIRFGIRSKDVHEGVETSDGPPEAHGDESSYLPGRHWGGGGGYVHEKHNNYPSE